MKIKSFKQYITEKLEKLMVLSPYAINYGKEDAIFIDGLVNPSRSEIFGFLNRIPDIARFVLHNDTLLVWNASLAIHADVIEGEFRLGRDFKIEYSRKSAHGYILNVSGDLYFIVPDLENRKWVSDVLKRNRSTKYIVNKDSVITEKWP